MNRVALAFYRLLLRFAPPDLRAMHGDEMEELFAAELDAARGQGWMAFARVVALGAADLVRRAPYEHWRRRGRPTLNVIQGAEDVVSGR